MLSRRDKLLLRPWQQKRFENHREKVLSALPRIDNKPPIWHDHISLKLKKQQLEKERLKKIEKDNLTLLRKLNHIMKTNRVDNYWRNPQPNFLNRVAIYTSSKPKVVENNEPVSIVPVQQKLHCSACNPQYIPEPTIPEERVPWPPLKQSINKRSQSVPLQKLLPKAKPGYQDVEFKVGKEKVTKRSKSCKAKEKKHVKLNDINGHENFYQSLKLSTGNLELVVNFPTDTSLVLKDIFSEKILLSKDCSCKGILK